MEFQVYVFGQKFSRSAKHLAKNSFQIVYSYQKILKKTIQIPSNAFERRCFGFIGYSFQSSFIIISLKSTQTVGHFLRSPFFVFFLQYLFLPTKPTNFFNVQFQTNLWRMKDFICKFGSFLWIKRLKVFDEQNMSDMQKKQTTIWEKFLCVKNFYVFKVFLSQKFSCLQIYDVPKVSFFFSFLSHIEFFLYFYKET